MQRLAGMRGVLLGIVGLGLVGCESMGTAGQSKTVQGGLLGGALGAASGAIIGHQTGRAGEGTAIGAGLGALAGAMVGNAMAEQQRAGHGGSVVVAEAPAKFCPVGGETFSEEIVYCPNHGVELRHRGQ